MNLETYLLFIGASIILCIAPGPDMIFLLSKTIAQGKKAGLLAAIGINVGAYVHLCAAVLGLSAIIATSSAAFTLLKWLGAAYLIYLGINAILLRRDELAIDKNSRGNPQQRAIFWQGFLSDVLNPKVAVFFLVFLPQFVDPSTENTTVQLLILGVTLNVIGIATNIALVYFSAKVTTSLRNNGRISTWLNKLVGIIFISLGIRLAFERAE